MFYIWVVPIFILILFLFINVFILCYFFVLFFFYLIIIINNNQYFCIHLFIYIHSIQGDWVPIKVGTLWMHGKLVSLSSLLGHL